MRCIFETGTGLQITPNSVLAAASITNLSRPPGKHTLTVTSVFAIDDAPDEVCAMLTRVASELPQCHPDRTPSAVALGAKEYQTKIPLRTPADDGKAKATFLRWVWYSARRAGLHLDETEVEFSSPERLANAIDDVVAPILRLNREEQQALIAHARLERYGAGELVQRSGEVPTGMKFILSGEVQLAATAEDGAEVVVTNLDEGSFLGQSTLTRQPVLGSAYALDEVTIVHIGRDGIEAVVQDNPLLLQELGRAIEQRRAHVLRAVATTEDDDSTDT